MISSIKLQSYIDMLKLVPLLSELNWKPHLHPLLYCPIGNQHLSSWGKSIYMTLTLLMLSQIKGSSSLVTWLTVSSHGHSGKNKRKSCVEGSLPCYAPLVSDNLDVLTFMVLYTLSYFLPTAVLWMKSPGRDSILMEMRGTIYWYSSWDSWSS